MQVNPKYRDYPLLVLPAKKKQAGLGIQCKNYGSPRDYYNIKELLPIYLTWRFEIVWLTTRL